MSKSADLDIFITGERFFLPAPAGWEQSGSLHCDPPGSHPAGAGKKNLSPLMKMSKSTDLDIFAFYSYQITENLLCQVRIMTKPADSSYLLKIFSALKYSYTAKPIVIRFFIGKGGLL